MAYLLFLVAISFGGIKPVGSACTGCTSGCTSLSIGAGGSYESVSFSCKDGNLPTLTLLDVSDGDSDKDGFTVTVMDGDNYQKFTNKQSYSYAANLGTGAVGSKSYTCSQNEGIDYKQAAGTTVYIVISCTNILETCHVKYKAVGSCSAPDPCLGMNCNYGTCFGGVCTCQDGYTGANCDQNPCASVYCINGYCSSGKCQCYDGYTGANCDIAPDPCAGVNCINGYCLSGKCQCYGGYTGANCDIAPDPCGEVFCGNFSTCSSGLCYCDEDYNGPPCTQNRLGHDSFGKAKLIAIICCSAGAFLIIVSTVGFLLIRRSRRHHRGMPEELLGDQAMSSEHFTATT